MSDKVNRMHAGVDHASGRDFTAITSSQTNCGDHSASSTIKFSKAESVPVYGSFWQWWLRRPTHYHQQSPGRDGRLAILKQHGFAAPCALHCYGALMGSGGTHCDGCRKRTSECECLPKPVEHESPCCPWCGEEYEASEKSDYTTVPCSCGHNFASERKVVFVSRALEHRN